MKTEREIRAYLDALRRVRHRPCDCDERSGRHQQECYVGGRMMDANVGLLRRVLGDSCEHDRMVETLLAEAARQ